MRVSVNHQGSFTDECGALESVKAASELLTPVSGKVVEKNSVVEEKTALINHSCFDEGRNVSYVNGTRKSISVSHHKISWIIYRYF